MRISARTTERRCGARAGRGRTTNSSASKWDVASGRATLMMQGWSPDLSPDGKWLVYTAREGNDTGVWVARASDGSKRRRISRGSAWNLGWAANKIHYATSAEIRVVTVSTSDDDATILADEVTPFRAQDGIHWFESHDGSRVMAVVQKQDPTDRALTLVSDFARPGK